MPYTKEELKNVDFYQKLVNELRDEYLLKVKKLKQDNFRRNNVLYSFEEIESTNGLDDLQVTTGIYENVIDENDIQNMKTVNNKKLNVITKKSLLEKTIDRNISELSELKVGKELPENIENGMVVTNDKADDSRRWLIENNTKREFSDLGTYYATDYSLVKLETFSQSIIDSIVTGDDIQ